MCYFYFMILIVCLNGRDINSLYDFLATISKNRRKYFFTFKISLISTFCTYSLKIGINKNIF